MTVKNGVTPHNLTGKNQKGVHEKSPPNWAGFSSVSYHSQIIGQEKGSYMGLQLPLLSIDYEDASETHSREGPAPAAPLI